MQTYYDHIAQVIAQQLGVEISLVLQLLEQPKELSHGDVAFPCFQLAKQLGKNPGQIAQELAAAIGGDAIVDHAQATGPYVNFFIRSNILAQDIIPSILQQGTTYGQSDAKNQKIVIESPSPNTNKPLHLGHVRNMLLGNSLDLISSWAGYESVKVEVVNDRGIHICKSMLAYQLFGNQQEPNKKSDHFVGDRYVLFDKKSNDNSALLEQAQEMLRKWEQGDPETRALWQKMNKRATDGFMVTYQRYGTRIDQQYFESDIYEDGKVIIDKALAQGIFVRDPKSNIAFPVTKKDGEVSYFVVLRADGTAVYATQDIALADHRFTDYHMDRMVYIVGNEQEEYFKTLFAVFKALAYSFADQCHHLSYGMIALPDGKMKSRKGNVVDADNLADDMHAQAREVLIQRYPDLSEVELDRRAEIIAMSAIKFFMLKYDVHKDFIFNREESLAFEGETGPYMLYSYARCMQVITKAGGVPKDIDYALLTEDIEKHILLHLLAFPDLVQKAAQEYKPNLVARYVLDLTQLFNRYYQQVHILTDDKSLQAVRVALLAAVGQVLHNALYLLGIEILEQM